MKRIGIFPGSFDPFTLGHLATVRQGLRLVDELVIAVMTNTEKRRCSPRPSVWRKLSRRPLACPGSGWWRRRGV
nr:adenylyltransferase/cytidyltransferase family protein [Lacticaseibacillus sharpeae]